MVDWTDKSHVFRIPICIVFGVGVLLCLLMLVFLVRRRHRMIIKERSFPLLLISCVGNLAGLTCISVDGFVEDDSKLESWALFYLTLFFEYVFFAPYVLRIYHIKVSYLDFLSNTELYRSFEHRLYFHWYWRFLVLGLIPYSLVPIFLGFQYHYSLYTSCSPSCPML